MHIPILDDILLILLAAVVIVFFLKRIKLPSIIGFLLTGIVIGPYAFAWIKAPSEIEQMSEIGVMLLLFVIGMELSIKELWNIRRNVFIGGALQVLMTIIVFSILYFLAGVKIEEAIFAGFMFSLSSTAIVLKLYQDRNEMHMQHAKNALAILIFQDIIVVPLMLVVPILAGAVENPLMSSLGLIVKIILLILFTWFSTKQLIPRLFLAIAKSDSKELFLLVTLAFCLVLASLTSLAGMSPALGAFIAGLIIAESNYSYQATALILPFREFFTSLFFVSVGMLLNLEFFAQHIPVVLGLVLLVFIVKSGLVAIAIFVLRYPIKTVLITGFTLFQVGEFSFILSKVGVSYGLLNEQSNQYFLSVSIVSMLLTPFIFLASENLSEFIIGLKSRLTKSQTIPKGYQQHSENYNEQPHLVIIGFGVNGRNVALAARESGTPFVVVDFNAALVKEKYKEGFPIIFGDAKQEHIMEAINLQKAKVVVIAISNAKETKQIVRLVRDINAAACIIVRTRYIKEMGELYALGANEVVPEEYETSIQIFSKVLNRFGANQESIEKITEDLRNDHYQLFAEMQKAQK